MNECPVCGNTCDSNVAACPSCGFRFGEKTEGFSRIEVEESNGTVRTAKPTSVSLRVVKGPQIQTKYLLEHDRTVIGRNPKCDVFLNDMTVSRSHAIIQKNIDGYVISDDNSFNGTWVNNRSVETVRLMPGDIIQLGAFCLVFEVE